MIFNPIPFSGFKYHVRMITPAYFPNFSCFYCCNGFGVSS